MSPRTAQRFKESSSLTLYALASARGSKGVWKLKRCCTFSLTLSDTFPSQLGQMWLKPSGVILDLITANLKKKRDNTVLHTSHAHSILTFTLFPFFPVLNRHFLSMAL